MDIHDMTGSEKRRPVFFNLMQIQMPVGALTSITHRDRHFLAISVPFGIYLLDFISPKTASMHKSSAFLTSGLCGLQRTFLYGC
jgi:succinate dehydrogenase / fumarate reductase cytochrome b subunit